MKHSRQRFSGDGRTELKMLGVISPGVSFNSPQLIVMTPEPIADITGADGSVIAELMAPVAHLKYGLGSAGGRMCRTDVLKLRRWFDRIRGITR